MRFVMTFFHCFQDFKCPLCSGGFIEQVDGDQPPVASNENASSQNTNRPVTTGQFTDVGIDESPPWNYRDENAPPPVSSYFCTIFRSVCI